MGIISYIIKTRGATDRFGGTQSGAARTRTRPAPTPLTGQGRSTSPPAGSCGPSECPCPQYPRFPFVCQLAQFCANLLVATRSTNHSGGCAERLPAREGVRREIARKRKTPSGGPGGAAAAKKLRAAKKEGETAECQPPSSGRALFLCVCADAALRLATILAKDAPRRHAHAIQCSAPCVISAHIQGEKRSEGQTTQRRRKDRRWPSRRVRPQRPSRRHPPVQRLGALFCVCIDGMMRCCCINSHQRHATASCPRNAMPLPRA